MILTGEQATQTVCHLTIGGKFRSNCIASKCMAWSWSGGGYVKKVWYDSNPVARDVSQAKDAEIVGDGWDFIPHSDEDHDARWIESDDFVDLRMIGYCGLVGKL